VSTDWHVRTHSWLIAGTPWLQALLGGALVIAAASKLHDPRGFVAALDALGIDRGRLRARLIAGVPFTEAGLGVWLWTGWNPVWSAVTAALVFVVLTAALIALRWRGHAGCGCFIGDRGVGPLVFVRNGILFALALCIAWASGNSSARQPALRAWDGPPLVAITIVMAVGASLTVTRRKTSSPARSADAAQPSVPAAVTPVESTDLTGARITLGRPAGAAQLVLFAKGRCPGCRRDRDLLNGLSLRPRLLETVIVCGGNRAETNEFAPAVRPPVRVVADPDWEIAVAWQVSTTPFTVLVDRQGQVRARGPLVAALALLPPRGDLRSNP
jgi:hypothetical protein